MKYFLIVFWLTSHWPMQEKIDWAQLGPYSNILACERASREAELVVKDMGASKVGSVCTATVEHLPKTP